MQCAYLYLMIFVLLFFTFFTAEGTSFVQLCALSLFLLFKKACRAWRFLKTPYPLFFVIALSLILLAHLVLPSFQFAKNFLCKDPFPSWPHPILLLAVTPPPPILAVNQCDWEGRVYSDSVMRFSAPFYLVKNLYLGLL